MEKINFKLLFTCISLLAFLVSCDEGTEENDPGFDRGNMLTQLADKLIIPNFQTLKASTDRYSDAIDVFVDAPSVDNLAAARNEWEQLAVDFQHCSAFGFGPASLPLGPFAEVIAVFPVAESKVESNINNPDFNLQASFDRDIRGLYTMEYLLYRKGLSDQEVVETFTAERIAYLQLILDEFKATVNSIVSNWTESYRQEFIESDGTSAGSSVSQLYNEFVKDYENLKNFKVELPAGLTAGQEGTDPTLVAAYYSGISKILIEEHFQSSVNIWAGTTREGESFTSFDDYLKSVVGGEELVTNTEAKINEIEGAINNLPAGALAENLSDPSLATLRNELQENTANFKSTMSSLLGISITFNSGDGD